MAVSNGNQMKKEYKVMRQLKHQHAISLLHVENYEGFKYLMLAPPSYQRIYK